MHLFDMEVVEWGVLGNKSERPDRAMEILNVKQRR
jgi:hypothetical protein